MKNLENANHIEGEFKLTSEFLRNIIDEAMRKKDRTISIFCSNQGTSVNIYPATDED